MTAGESRKYGSIEADGFTYWWIPNAAGHVIPVMCAEDEVTVFAEIFAGSDRVLTIVSVAYLEDALREVLRAFFVDHRNTKALLNPDNIGALNFHQLAGTTFACGLIRETDYSLLKAMAKLRNQFAHHADIQDFATLESATGVRGDLKKAMKTINDRGKMLIDEEFTSAIEMDTLSNLTEDQNPDPSTLLAVNFSDFRQVYEYVFGVIAEKLVHVTTAIAIENARHELKD